MYDRLVKFVVLWYIFPVLVYLDKEKSGNLVPTTYCIVLLNLCSLCEWLNQYYNAHVWAALANILGIKKPL
jgi:hypothetical protein